MKNICLYTLLVLGIYAVFSSTRAENIWSFPDSTLSDCRQTITFFNKHGLKVIHYKQNNIIQVIGDIPQHYVHDSRLEVLVDKLIACQ